MAVVVYDANVLYPNTLRDFLMRLHIAGAVRAHWSEPILDEVVRNLAKNRPEKAREQWEKLRLLLNRAVPDASVTGFENRIDQLTLPDVDDRHVLAAAIEIGAEIIVTSNLEDFPKDELAKYEIVAQSPR